MAQQQVNINIAEVGFNGIDTVSSPITQDNSFAAVADNCVIDRYGRIGARKAFAQDTETFPSVTAIPGAASHKWVLHQIQGGTLLDSLAVLMTAEYIGIDSNGFEVGRSFHVLKRNGTALEAVVVPPVLGTEARTADIVPTDDRWYICTEGNETFTWDGTSTTLLQLEVGYVGIQTVPAGPQVPPEFVGAVASHGRIWGWGHKGDYQTIYYSDLLIGASYYTVDGVDPLSTAGAINVLEYWPNGRDEIQGVTVHNNKLIVFGRRSVLIFEMGYGDPADPASGFALQDTITNIGLVNRDAVVNIGSDILFLDDTGVRSLGRTIQEDSSPMGDMTFRVRSDITSAIVNQADKTKLKMEYDSTNNVVIVLFDGFSYVLDLKAYTINGIARITRWTQCAFNGLTYCESAGANYLFFAGNDNQGVALYEGYLSYNNEPYLVKYQSNPMTFGQPAHSKFVKQIDLTIISRLASGDGIVRWGYDTLSPTKSRTISIDAINPSYYGVAEYAVDAFGNSDSTYKRYRVNTGGRGEAFIVGFEVDVAGNDFSLQEINIQALLGRMN